MKKTITPRVAYFSMEIALEPDVPTYSGGLGILAGDTLRSAADLGTPVVAVTLAYRKGYFRQILDSAGNQFEQPQEWDPEQQLPEAGPRVSVEIEGRQVIVRAWRYTITGISGEIVPVLLLDTDLPENSEFDRSLTDSLYGGDQRYRLAQEIVLGLGGFQLLQKLYSGQIETYHQNEGHSALLSLGLLERRLEQSFAGRLKKLDIVGVRNMCIFTTHTPVPAGHDQFPRSLVSQILGRAELGLLDEAEAWEGDALNMTYLALRFSGYVNGVAMRHGEVSRGMFPAYEISAITNGVHAITWTSPAFAELFDSYIPGWRTDNNYLRYAISIPLPAVREAHADAKTELFAEISRAFGVQLDPKLLTIGFARRASTYKRADLLFQDAERLRKIAREVGPIQLVYGGKAHPHDEGGKNLIRRVVGGAGSLADVIRTVYVENYDMRWGRLITSGVDLWLNTPMRPQEAEIVPMFYGRPNRYTEIMRFAIALNGSFFNTQRMLLQYISNAYKLHREVAAPLARV